MFKTTELLKNLALDTWYKALLYLGAILVFASLFVDIEEFANSHIFILGFGIFFSGLGYWKNMKTEAWIKEANVYTGPATLVQTKVRHPDLLGRLFEIIGVALIVGAVYLIITGDLVR